MSLCCRRFRNAQKTVWLSATCFVPTDQEQDDLIAAARRGVNVRLLALFEVTSFLWRNWL
jgi:phosphatidylserine/phosphatidylglycerophosphate/cardiolipin synthase-like enzyme